MAEWKNLPIKLKQKIVQRLDQDSRFALKTCSTHEKSLVDSVEINSLFSLRIGFDADPLFNLKGRWIIQASKHRGDNDTKNFGSFEDFQSKIYEIMEAPIHRINQLKIYLMNSKIPMKLLPEKMPQIVEDIYFADGCLREEVISVLEQIEPGDLKCVEIASDGGNEALYDMRQIIHAEKITIVRKTCIREDQLLKLNARCINLTFPTFPMNKYIMKSVFQANTKLSEFSFEFPDQKLVDETLFNLNFSRDEPENRPKQDKFIMNTPYPGLKLEIVVKNESEFRILEGAIRCSSERISSSFLASDSSDLRIVKQLQVTYQPEIDWNITVDRKNQPLIVYTFNLFNEVQEKMDEILENTDYIKYFGIDTGKSEEVMKFHNNHSRPFIVEKLEASGMYLNQTLVNLLDKIEPVDLRNLMIDSESVEGSVFDMEQVINTDELDIRKACLRDDQLLKLICKKLTLSLTIKNNHASLITASGVNHYLKKFSLHLDKYEQCRIYNWEPVENQLLENLNVVSTGDETQRQKFIVDSGHPKFLMRILLGDDRLEISRILKD